jgi:hypothetical protein
MIYLPQICDMGQTALLPLRKKKCWGFFRPKKADGFGWVRTAILGSRDQHGVLKLPYRDTVWVPAGEIVAFTLSNSCS